MFSLDDQRTAGPALIGSTLLECRDVEQRFGGMHVLNGITVNVQAGQVIGLVGANGAGKTTLFDIISGFRAPSSGEVYFDGKRIDGRPPWRVARRGVGRLFQDLRLFQKLSVLDNVLVAIPDQDGEAPLNALIRRPRIKRQEQANEAVALQWLEFVGLTDHAHDLAERLSYGQQRLLALARLLASGARLLLLDEPAAGVQRRMVQRILDLIRSLAGEQDRAVFLIEHDLATVANCVDELYFIDQGRIVAHGEPQVLLADRALRRTYLGI